VLREAEHDSQTAIAGGSCSIKLLEGMRAGKEADSRCTIIYAPPETVGRLSSCRGVKCALAMTSQDIWSPGMVAFEVNLGMVTFSNLDDAVACIRVPCRTRGKRP
jgi:hypothetical protein